MAEMELQEWDWSIDEWKTIEEYSPSTDSRAEGNALYSYQLRSSMRPTRLLKDGVTLLGSDDPNVFYNA